MDIDARTASAFWLEWEESIRGDLARVEERKRYIERMLDKNMDASTQIGRELIARWEANRCHNGELHGHLERELSRVVVYRADAQKAWAKKEPVVVIPVEPERELDKLEWEEK